MGSLLNESGVTLAVELRDISPIGERKDWRNKET